MLMRCQPRLNASKSLRKSPMKDYSALESCFAFWIVMIVLPITSTNLVSAQGTDSAYQTKQSVDPALDEGVGQPLLSQPFTKKRPSSYPKIHRYAQYLMSLYDQNRDGQLQEHEWKAMHGHPELIAPDGNGVITLQELTTWVSDYGRRKAARNSVEQNSGSTSSSPKRPASGADGMKDSPSPLDQAVDGSISVLEQSASGESANETNENAQGTPIEKRRDQKFYVSDKRLPAGLPDWFFARDKDGDGQLTVSEYLTTGGASEQAEFNKLDANGDGVVTAKECVRKAADKPSAAKGSTEVLPDQSGEKNSKTRRKPRSTAR